MFLNHHSIVALRLSDGSKSEIESFSMLWNSMNAWEGPVGLGESLREDFLFPTPSSKTTIQQGNLTITVVQTQLKSNIRKRSIPKKLASTRTKPNSSHSITIDRINRHKQHTRANFNRTLLMDNARSRNN